MDKNIKKKIYILANKSNFTSIKILDCVEKKNIEYNIKNNFCDFFIKLLITIGVKNAIGILGSDLFKLYETMISNNINVIIARNEMSASYTPIGNTRVCKNRNDIKRSFCLAFASDGPGALNLSNGVAQAIKEQIPSIYIINRNVNLNNNNRIIQQINTPVIYKNISKSVIIINKKSIEEKKIFDQIYNGIILGLSYPQGPIVFFIDGESMDIELIKYYEIKELIFYLKKFADIFTNNYGYAIKNKLIGPNYTNDLYTSKWISSLKIFNNENNKKIVYEYKNFIENMIENSKKPVFLFGEGSGIFQNNDLFLDICKILKIPYLITTPMKQIIDSDDILYAEITGHFGSYCGNMTISNADLLICFGTSFNIYMTINLLDPFKNIKKIVSVNINPELYKTPFVDYYIIEDAIKVITNIDCNNIRINHNERNNWILQIQKYKEIGANKINYFYSKNDNENLKQGDIYNVIQYHIDKFNIKYNQKYIYFVVDSGSSQLFSTSLLNFRKKYQLISSFAWGAIGNGVGLAIGAAINNPNDLFILIAGDSGSLLSISDYLTIKEANLKNMIVIIIENGGLALVSEASLEVSSKTLEYGNGYKNYPNWINLFNGLNLNATITKTKKEFNESFENAINNKVFIETVVIVAVVSMDLYYAPIVAIGSSAENMKYLYDDYNKIIDDCRISNLD